MQRIKLLTTFLAIAALAILGAGLALADGSKNVAVKPLTPKAGEVIIVKGGLLGPNAEVEVRVVGPGVDVDLGEVKTDAEGDFTEEFRLPADLPPGTYQVKANGPQSAVTQITVLAAGSAAQSPMAPAPAEPLRERPLAQTVGLVAVFGVLAGLGLFLALTARRVSRHEPLPH